MSHACVLVVTPTPEDVSGALRPFRLATGDTRELPHFEFVPHPAGNLDTAMGRRGFWRNPIGEWDGWVVGGNWTGLLTDGSWTKDQDNDGPSQRRRDDLDHWLQQHSDRLREIYAVVYGGRWHPARQDCTEVERMLVVLERHFWVTIVDCHS